MKFVLSLFISAAFICSSQAQDLAPARRSLFNLDRGLAIEGYDPVAYFQKGRAIKGKKELSLLHDGVTYYFSSAANRETFRKHPAAYEPQYGGWCAFAMAKGEKVSIDPETFKIADHKLYLFYNSFLNNTLKSWNKDEAKLKSSADKHWSQLFQ